MPQTPGRWIAVTAVAAVLATMVALGTTGRPQQGAARHAPSVALPRAGTRHPAALAAAERVAKAATTTTVPARSGPAAAATTATSPYAPLPATALQVSQDGAAPDLEATWAYTAGGQPALGAIVQIYTMATATTRASTPLGQLTCEASCTSVVFRSLSFGVRYQVAVLAFDIAAAAAPVYSSTITLTESCSASACVTLDATSPIGPANHADSGILNSVFSTGHMSALMNGLATSMYRGSPSYNSNGTLNWTTWNVAVASGAQTTLVLSDLWTTYNGGQPPTPWSNWTTYNNWVKATVAAVLASGEKVSYWEVYNEPGSDDNYYSAANFATVTPALLLQQFLSTYQDIKSVDPAAGVIGPSLPQWQDYAGEYGTSTSHEFDMVTFLNFAAANGIQLAAVSWHEITDSLGPNPAENTVLPAVIEDHVAEARQLIAARPSLGHPLIFINEYAMPEVQLIPGWDVAYLAALTNAGVDSAGRSCWGGACANPTLDGLLATDGTTPWNEFYDRVVYAAMSGSMIANSSTSDYVTALGSYNSSTRTVTALVGRGVGCSQDPMCGTTGTPDQPPAPVKVTVDVPFSSGTATLALTDIPGGTLGPVTSAPVPVTTTVPIQPVGNGKGAVTITIPSFADGDAYGISITNL
ncbi:MAG TPA: hypothetical protein VL961_05960 [Acidimicrobiales bacterium]|nr:hypothetical protein [Acidimicrobiales bacterium]